MRAPAAEYELLLWNEVEDDDEPLSPALAAGWLRRWLASPEHRGEVIELYRAMTPVHDFRSGWLDERELDRYVRPRIERALATGELVLVRREDIGDVMLPVSFEEGAGVAAGPPVSSSGAGGGAPAKTWVELLVTDMSGNPVKDVNYRAILPDGSKKTGKTDANGVARFDEIDPGVCEFLLVDYDGDAIESLEEAARREKAAERSPGKAKVAPPPPPPTEEEEQEEEVFVLSAALRALGDVPLVRRLVRILDPDTGGQVGKEVETDDEGVVRVEVPERKDYRVEVVEEEIEIAEPPPPLPEPRPAVLVAQFVDPAGAPVALEYVAVDAEGDDDASLETDEEGRIEAPAPLGPCTLKIRGQEFVAHSLPAADARAAENLYRFVVEEERQ